MIGLVEKFLRQNLTVLVGWIALFTAGYCFYGTNGLGSVAVVMALIHLIK